MRAHAVDLTLIFSPKTIAFQVRRVTRYPALGIVAHVFAVLVHPTSLAAIRSAFEALG